MAHNVGPIQVALAGLYGMLGVKDGSNPDVITGFVQPTLEAGHWWLRATQSALRASVNVTATGALQQIQFATIPQNEWWHVESAVAVCQLDITTVQPGYGVQWVVLEPALPAVYYQTEPIPLVTDAAGNVFYQVGPGVAAPQAIMRDVWLPPGSRIFAYFQGNIANPDTVRLSMYGTACRI